MNKTDKALTIIILAAGAGSRMYSSRPKVLHMLAGRSLLAHVIAAAQSCAPQQIILVTAPAQDTVRDAADRYIQLDHAFQEHPRGTGDAVMAACPQIAKTTRRVLILFGDTPLITPSTLSGLVNDTADISLLGFTPPEPSFYGRIIMDGDTPTHIIEHADASDADRSLSLCNGGAMAVRADLLPALLAELVDNNEAGELYLTDIVARAHAVGCTARVIVGDCVDAQGVNSRADLAMAETLMQERLRVRALEQGVSMQAPETVYLSYDTAFGCDIYIEPHVVFGCGVTIADNVLVRAFSHIEHTAIAVRARIGPFARLRGNSAIGADSRIGNFVELKAAQLGTRVKINHLSYIGDATLGDSVNIGAGTITCNYDGVAKYQTQIEDGVFVGSNSVLIAPITIGADAYLGSGTVVSKNVPAKSLALTRAPLRLLANWARRTKTPKD